jgi:arylsulfatase A-like enzyme
VAPPPPPPPPVVNRLPNIILILSDDEDVASHALLSKTKTLLQDPGTSLSNFFVTYSLCCPSRASILRGQYPHNTKVEANEQPFGGYLRFRNLGREQATIATWLQAAGYRTLLIGKYLNGYGFGVVGANPPGWAQWSAGIGDQPYNGFNYSIDEDGTFVPYGSAPSDYLTDVIARKATAAIRQAARDSVPLFLYLSPFTPHLPAVPAPRHAGLFTTAQLPTPPNFNEADVSDKPLAIRSRPLLGPSEIAGLTTIYQKRLRSLQAIDDLVDSVVTALEKESLLNKSWIFYMSDNGFHLGEHRGLHGKNLPYEEDLRVPFIVRGPGVPAGRVVDQIGLNIDLASTFVDIARGTTTVPQDGRSLLPLLKGGGPANWRQSFQAERGPNDTASIFLRTEETGSQVELGDAAERFPGTGWNAIRTARWKYVEWETGERELYDLGGDPYEMTNLLFSGGDTTAAPALETRLHQLMTCAGPQCSEVEDLPVP